MTQNVNVVSGFWGSLVQVPVQICGLVLLYHPDQVRQSDYLYSNEKKGIDNNGNTYIINSEREIQDGPGPSSFRREPQHFECQWPQEPQKLKQGSHSTAKTENRGMVKSNSRQGKHREFENFGKTQGI